MAAKANNAEKKTLEILHGWQLHRELSDEDMANGLGVSRSTYLRWRTNATAIPHDMLVRCINMLHMPQEEAVQALTAGLRV